MVFVAAAALLMLVVLFVSREGRTVKEIPTIGQTNHSIEDWQR